MRDLINRFSIPLAFVCVLIVWTTTPLAIQWSAENAPITSAFYRMVIGVSVCAGVLVLFGGRLPRDRNSAYIYLVGGVALFLGTALFYLSAQHIPSGWIAVVFGLSPLITGVFSAFVEPQAQLTRQRFVGLLFGMAGIFLVFSEGIKLHEASFVGLAYAVGAVTLLSATSVYSRQLVRDRPLTGLQITVGSLLISVPLFFVTALFVSPSFDVQFSERAIWSIFYLGVIGSGVGLTLYYFLLKEVSASKIALVGLVTPITALILGAVLNNEPVIGRVYIGAALVCMGLIFYQFKPRLGLRHL